MLVVKRPENYQIYVRCAVVDFRSFARKPVAVDSFLRCPGKNVDEGVGDFCQEQRRFGGRENP